MEFLTCKGVIAQKSISSSNFLLEKPNNFQLLISTRSIALTNIIFLEIYSTGKQSNAKFLSLNSKNHKFYLLSNAFSLFLTSKTLGTPVEPEV